MRSERGFGLIELVIAMTVLSVALLALMAAFSSATVGSTLAARTATAGAIADIEMEAYRAMIYDTIGIDTTQLSGVDSTYKQDVACWDSASGKDCTQSGSPSSKKITAPAANWSCTNINTWYPTAKPCTPSRTINSSSTPASPDGRSYRIDLYVATFNGSGTTQRAHKIVSVVVRDGTSLRVLAREQGEFDCSTGDTTHSACP